jgi:hypothetical protein
MNGIMLETFNLLGSEFNFEVSSRSYFFVTGEIMRKTEELLLRKDITTVIVYGSGSQPSCC